MMGVLALFIALFISGFSHTSALKPRQQVTLRGLWDERVNQDVTHATQIGAKGSARHTTQVALAAGGALLRSEKMEKMEPESSQVMPGSTVRLFMLRDGLQLAQHAKFDGPSELSKRLQEVQQRCPGALGHGWVLMDSGKDIQGGHHWALKGPKGVNAAAQSFLHVSSARSRKANEGHDALSFSPQRLCHELPAAMIEKAPCTLDSQCGEGWFCDDANQCEERLAPEGVQQTQAAGVNTFAAGGLTPAQHAAEQEAAATTDPNDAVIGGKDSAQCTNPLVIDAVAAIAKLTRDSTIGADFAVSCGKDASDTPSLTVANATCVSADTEVTEPLTVYVVVKLTPEGGGAGSYHTFAVDCTDTTCEHDGNIRETPPDGKASVGWCDILDSTQSAHPILAELPEELTKKLGLLTGYRDFRPDPDLLLEEAGTRKSTLGKCLEQPMTQDTYTIRADSPDCLTPALIEEQGDCGACWAFATMQALGARACIKWGRTMMHGQSRKSFSNQMVMSCNTGKFGCAGGSLGAAYEESRKGIAFEETYPYHPGYATEFPWHGFGEHCQWGHVPKPFIVSAHYSLQRQVKLNTAKLQSEIFCNGPVAAGIEMMSTFWNFMKDGPQQVFTKEEATKTGSSRIGYHAITISGWGVHDNCHIIQQQAGCANATKCAWDANGEELKKCKAKAPGGPIKFWECANSWGRTWGDDGFFKMERDVDACKIESLTIHAGEVQPTKGSWMYKDWEACNDATKEKTRKVECTSNYLGRLGCSTWEVGCVEKQDKESCPKTEGPDDKVTWPSVEMFPGNVGRAPSSKKLGENQELQAAKSCTDSPAECTGWAGNVAYCNGKGTANMAPGGDCTCQCHPFYIGESCDQCSEDASGYPRCRGLCVAGDCNSHGTAAGNKWLTEFGTPRDNCECTCTVGFTGAKCDQCSNPVTHTYPECRGSVAYVPLKDRLSTSTGPPTTTHFYSRVACKKDSRPIELMPPVGKHWLTIDCDVRKGDCDPDYSKCLRGVQGTYCAWHPTTAFPKGQCVNAQNTTSMHAKIEGTERIGEDYKNRENRSRLSTHRSSGSQASNNSANVTSNSSANDTAAANSSVNSTNTTAANATAAAPQ